MAMMCQTANEHNPFHSDVSVHILCMYFIAEGPHLVVADNTVVMSNGDLVWDNPDTHTAMLDRLYIGYTVQRQIQSLN